jgi:nitrous oxidase accessory protein NosD
MSTFRVLTFVCAMVAFGSTLAEAQATRTWVSGVGDDANPCSRTAPCKTWSGAISKTAAGGEINALDPGGFGTLTITKSITIVGDGTMASTLAALTNGFRIAAATTDVVTLRGLDINGAGNGLQGIIVTSAAAVHIENCLIYGFTQNAIDASATNAGLQLFVKDTIVRNNTRGIFVGGTVNATLDNVRVQQSGFGVRAVNNADVIVRNSVIAGNNTGLAAVATAGLVTLMSENTATVNNGTGILSQGADARVRLSNTTIVGNQTGISSVTGGAVISFGNNRITGNNIDGAPNSSVLQQ